MQPTTQKKISLSRYLIEAQHTKKIPPELRFLIEVVARACKNIAYNLNKGGLADIFGSNNSNNIQGETQQKLDIIANEVLLEANEWGGHLAAMASEEMDTIYKIPNQYPSGGYLLLFDPLDGSSNIDVNVSIGTIFSVLKKYGSNEVHETDFLQEGKQQVASGYAIYGPQTTLVITIGDGVHIFTLDKDMGSFILTRSNVTIPQNTQEFSINMSNMRHWDEAIKKYINECLSGEEGIRGKNFNMRWVASMVADVHRILTRGGIFMYPWDKRDPNKAGKLRLMYEANPMSMLIEQAGGMAINGKEKILNIKPQNLHQRVAVIMGSKNEVELVHRYYLDLP